MKFSDAIRDAYEQAMTLDPKVLCYGLGVTDPRRIFGTTQGLAEKFGNDRVFDMPISENAMTGVGIGLAIRGYRPVFTHQRLDFYLLAMDQLVNGAAKWHMMFGGKMSVPLTIRLILGRGWGQGPTHSQALHAWFAHIPGLKVVMPSNPADAKGLLMASIFDNNPVVFLEHRWLHAMEGNVPSGDHRTTIGKANIIQEGDDLTIVANSIMIPEALLAAETLKQHKISTEIIDLHTVRPIDWETIQTSVNKTGRLLTLDIGAETGAVAGEIIAHIASSTKSTLKKPPQRICMPDYAVPTSVALTEHMYPGAFEIAQKSADMLEIEIPDNALNHLKKEKHDVPGNWFKGPF